MKLAFRALLGAVIVVLGAGLAVRITGRDRDLPKLSPIEFSREGSAPKTLSIEPSVHLPRRAMVYRLRRIPVTEERIRTLATNLGVPDEPGVAHLLKRLDDGEMRYGVWITRDRSVGDYRARSTGEVVRITSDGEFRYCDPRTEAARGGRVPTADEFRRTVFGFLRKSKLLRPGAKLRVLWLETLRQSWAQTDDPDVYAPWEIRVDIIDPADPTNNSRADIQVGKDGTVDNMVLELPTVEPFHSYPLKNERELLEALSTDEAYYYNQDTYFAPASGRIRSLELSYMRNKDGFLLPICRFAGTITLPAGVSRGGSRFKMWGHTIAVEQRFLRSLPVRSPADLGG